MLIYSIDICKLNYQLFGQYYNFSSNQFQETMIKKLQYDDSNSETNSQDSFEQQSQDIDQSQNHSAKIGLEQNQDFFQKHGMFFCGKCKNLMHPHHTKGDLLDFKCRRCGIIAVDFKERKQKKCMLFSRSLHSSSKKTELENRLIFDCSMPIMSIQCPECDYDQAVYTVVPQEGERRIVLNLICSRGAKQGIVKCGKKWQLRQDIQIDEDTSDGAMKARGSIEEEDWGN